MIELLIGVALVLIGAFIFMQMGSKSSGSDADAANGNSTEASDAQKEKESAEQARQRETELKELTVPQSLPEIAVYFGSQTGTAEKLAGVLDEEAHLMGVPKLEIVDFNNFNEETFLKHKMAIVVVATHYEGDPCDNTRNFHKWLKKQLKEKNKCFEGMKYTIFGLGDTSYEQYNEMGKQFDEGFEKLGGERIHELGDGNAETFSTEDDFDKWKQNLWSKIFEIYAKLDTPEQKQKALVRRRSSVLHSGVEGKPDALPWIIDDSGLTLEDESEPQYDMNMRNFTSSVDLPIKDMRELRQQAEFGASTLEVVFDLSGTGLTYETAANFAIYPVNDEANVKEFAEQHELDLEKKFTFTKNFEFRGRPPKVPFPTNGEISFKDALTKFIDLTGAMTKKTLTSLIPLCESQDDKKVLQDAVKNGSKSYDEIFIGGKLGLIDMKKLLPSLKITPEVLFQKCQLIMPRYYTIASSSTMHPQDLHIAISLSTIDTKVDGQTIQREGLVSGYLNKIWASWQKGEKQTINSKCFVKNSNFSMPKSHETPMIMVGPGTGVVPFIGFMQERQMARQADADQPLADAHLYFGCRESNSDFIYRDLMADMKDNKMISTLNVAVSRPSEAGAVKQYVQDQLRENKDMIKTLLTEQNGEFFICGATKMGKDVETLLREILGPQGLKSLQTQKRYKVELWSS